MLSKPAKLASKPKYNPSTKIVKTATAALSDSEKKEILDFSINLHDGTKLLNLILAIIDKLQTFATRDRKLASREQLKDLLLKPLSYLSKKDLYNLLSRIDPKKESTPYFLFRHRSDRFHGGHRGHKGHCKHSGQLELIPEPILTLNELYELQPLLTKNGCPFNEQQLKAILKSLPTAKTKSLVLREWYEFEKRNNKRKELASMLGRTYGHWTPPTVRPTILKSERLSQLIELLQKNNCPLSTLQLQIIQNAPKKPYITPSRKQSSVSTANIYTKFTDLRQAAKIEEMKKQSKSGLDKFVLHPPLI